MINNIHSPFGQIIIENNQVNLKLVDDKGTSDCQVIRYDVVLPNGKIVLHKLTPSNEWFPNGLNGHYPIQTITTLRAIIENHNL